MRAGRVAADRAEAVRRAAQGWHRAGAIDAATLAAIQQAHADDHLRFRPALRALVFVLTLVAVNGATGFVLTLFGSLLREEAAWAPVFFLFGAGLLAATEWLTGARRLLRAGAEEATALVGIGFWLAAIGTGYDLLGFGGSPSPTLLSALFLTSALLFAAAAWRWGMVWAGALAAGSLLLFLLQLPVPRAWWLLAGAGLAPALLFRGRSERLAPSHREALRVAGAVLLAGLYLALNLSSADRGWVEALARPVAFDKEALTGLPRLLAAAGTVFLPPACVWLGLRRRDRLWLNAGLLFAVASLTTVRDYVAVAPLWVLLAGAGLALIGLALALRRWLDAGPGQSRAGWTAEPLYEDAEGRSVAEVAASLVVASPEARALDRPPGFEGKGGHFGGGGAESDF